MEPILHVGRFREVLLEEVDDGTVFLAHVKRDEVSRPVVPRATARDNGRMCGIPGLGEVSRASPSSGCFPYADDLVYLWLLQQRDCRVEWEESKDPL